jgi:hypothetical protein
MVIYNTGRTRAGIHVCGMFVEMALSRSGQYNHREVRTPKGEGCALRRQLEVTRKSGHEGLYGKGRHHSMQI